MFKKVLPKFEVAQPGQDVLDLYEPNYRMRGTRGKLKEVLPYVIALIGLVVGGLFIFDLTPSLGLFDGKGKQKAEVVPTATHTKEEGLQPFFAPLKGEEEDDGFLGDEETTPTPEPTTPPTPTPAPPTPIPPTPVPEGVVTYGVFVEGEQIICTYNPATDKITGGKPCQEYASKTKGQ